MSQASIAAPSRLRDFLLSPEKYPEPLAFVLVPCQLMMPALHPYSPADSPCDGQRTFCCTVSGGCGCTSTEEWHLNMAFKGKYSSVRSAVLN